MRIEHAAMYVSDLEAARDFFITYLGASCSSGYHNETTGLRSFFLSFQGGARLEIMNSPAVRARSGQCRETGYAHIAFSLGSREAVERLTARLREDGYAVVSGPRTTGDGYYESCILDMEGNPIELTV